MDSPIIHLRRIGRATPHAYPLFKPNCPTVIARSAAAHGEPVEPRGNLVEVEHTLANHHCYGDEIANPRIKYGGAMTDYSAYA